MNLCWTENLIWAYNFRGIRLFTVIFGNIQKLHLWVMAKSLNESTLAMNPEKIWWKVIWSQTSVTLVLDDRSAFVYFIVVKCSRISFGKYSTKNCELGVDNVHPYMFGWEITYMRNNWQHCTWCMTPFLTGGTWSVRYSKNVILYTMHIIYNELIL